MQVAEYCDRYDVLAASISDIIMGTDEPEPDKIRLEMVKLHRRGGWRGWK